MPGDREQPRSNRLAPGPAAPATGTPSRDAGLATTAKPPQKGRPRPRRPRPRRPRRHHQTEGDSVNRRTLASVPLLALLSALVLSLSLVTGTAARANDPPVDF